MATKFFTFFICLLLTSASFSQIRLMGKVVDAMTALPIASASVFLSNTSIGVTTDANGNFMLECPANINRISLIASCIGYDSYQEELTLCNKAGKTDMIIKIHIKSKELDQVIVTPFDKHGWEIWGNFFIKNFIGTSVYAKECKIKNERVLKFWASNNDSSLTVIAEEPLIIENRSLGYNLIYDLKKFEYKASNSGFVTTYSGHPFFKALTPRNRKEAQRWETNRAEAYSNSLTHFIRSLYSQTTQQEGYHIQKMGEIKDGTVVGDSASNDRNSEFDTDGLDTIYLIKSDIVNINIVKSSDAPNSNHHPKLNALFGQNILAHIDNGLYLYFEKALKIFYDTKLGLKESEISLIKPEPILINSDGSFYEATNLQITGFWSSWEKIAIMLPYDYQPPNKTSSK